MLAFYQLFNQVVGFYSMIVIAAVIANLLMAFNVIDPRNPYVSALVRGLYAVTEPILRRIRNFLPSMGGLDFSPVVLLVGLQFFQTLVNQYVFGAI